MAKEEIEGPLNNLDLPSYQTCLARKTTRKPSEREPELTYTGPMNVRARHGALYFIMFIGDYTSLG